MSKKDLVKEYMALEVKYVEPLNREDFILHTQGYFDENFVDLENDDLGSLKRAYYSFEEHCLTDESEEEIKTRINNVRAFIDE